MFCPVIWLRPVAPRKRSGPRSPDWSDPKERIQASGRSGGNVPLVVKVAAHGGDCELFLRWTPVSLPAGPGLLKSKQTRGALSLANCERWHYIRGTFLELCSKTFYELQIEHPAQTSPSHRTGSPRETRTGILELPTVLLSFYKVPAPSAATSFLPSHMLYSSPVLTSSFSPLHISRIPRRI